MAPSGRAAPAPGREAGRAGALQFPEPAGGPTASLSVEPARATPALPGPGPVGVPAALGEVTAIALGEVTRRHLARVLEQSQGTLLLACVEAAGGDPGGRWRLVLDGARLELSRTTEP